MGFYALWKWFPPWSKRDYPDMIYWYKEYVLKLLNNENKRRDSKRKARTTLAQLSIMDTMCRNLGGGYR